jgi:hypothetical protein
MADVFVSYAKTDRPLASKLVAMLEAEGWKVWWDTSLATADLYRDEIMKQLASARAVIAIWTPNSIRSDWVRAEAGRAKAEGKLIPVKTPDVAYADIPLPFGEMHTENLESIELIRAAIVAQLAKPAVEPSAIALLVKDFKYELLTWFGIIGGALTLFTNLSAAIKLSDFARILVEHWSEWTHGFWVWAFGWLGIHLPPVWTPILSFLLFGLSLTIGQVFKFRKAISTTGLRKYVSLTKAMNAKDHFHMYLWVGLWNLFFAVIVRDQFERMEVDKLTVYSAYAIPALLSIILLSVAPAKAVSRRLIFLALGLILLIALNELSKVGLDVTAPKFQG